MLSDLTQTASSTHTWAIRMADSALAGYTPLHWKWHYEHGLLLKAVWEVGVAYNLPHYGQFVRDWLDHFITPNGRIRGYQLREFNLDQINPGKLLIYACLQRAEARYVKAIEHLYRQLLLQPRTNTGIFWHKKIYPHQVWLDGLYMAQPFLSGYARLNAIPDLFNDVTRQVILAEALMRDPETGLLYHGWDESRRQRWSNPRTGCSPSFWGRGMGWYAMALVDVLELLPGSHPNRAPLIEILSRLAQALSRFQDAASGMWYQVVNLPDRAGNYLESSVSAMLAYAFAKAVRLGFLTEEYLPVARRAYRGLLENRIKVDAQGAITLEGICGVAGLGGNPYRDGTFEYYISEKTIPNDFKGVGPFILAALELDHSGAE